MKLATPVKTGVQTCSMHVAMYVGICDLASHIESHP